MIRDAQTDATDPLPRVMLPDGVATLTEFTSWSASNAGRLRALLLESGALLFRGFGFEHPAAFQEFTRIFAPTLRRYVGGASPRKRVHENVYTSTDASPRHRMSQHHEASYLASMPAVVAFLCQVPAATGGCTPLARGRLVTAQLPAEIRDVFARRGVRYVNSLHGGMGFGKSWQATFETTDRAEVEEVLRADGYTWQWRPDGGLRTERFDTAFKTHPVTGESIWVTQVDYWHPSSLDPATRQQVGRLLAEPDFPTYVTFGDGGTIDEPMLNDVRRVVASETVRFEWQAGDVLVCDNFLVSHGRDPFTGPRKVLVALG